MTCLLTLLLALNPPAAAEAPSVLLMGNSYTQFNDLDAILADVLVASTPGADRPLTVKLVAGGLTLPDHLGRLDPSTGSPAWQAALAPGETWGAVLLQDQSQIPGFPESEPLWQASRDAALELDLRAADAGAQTLLFLTWGRRLGDDRNPEMYPDFSTMQDRLTAGYRAYGAAITAASGRPAYIAPVGPAFAVVHDAVLAAGEDPIAPESAFTALFNADGSHPSPGGSYLAACVIAQSLTGWPTQGGDWGGPIDADSRSHLQAVADGLVVDDPFGDWAWPWAQAWDEVVEPGTDPVTLGDPDMRLQVGLDSEIGEIGRLDLNDAVLNILEGGSIRLPQLLDSGENGASALILRGGSAEIGAIAVPVRVVAGRLDQGPGARVGGDLILEPAATWVFDAADGALQVAGAGALEGALWVEAPSEGRLLAQFASEPKLGELTVDPPGWRASLLFEDEVWRLVLNEGEAADTGDGPGQDSDAPGGSGPAQDADAAADSGCGCGGGAAALPLFLAWAGVGAALRRRPAAG